MVSPVGIVTVHHEGAGSPSDNVDRFSEGGYCCGIGVTLWKRFRAPRDNWATMNFNHRDLTICLSGNRMTAPVTDTDLKLIHDAYMDFHRRGEVVAEPEVRPHRRSPGSSTVCPGDKAMDRWPAIASACRLYAPRPEPVPEPPPLEEDLLTCVAFGPNQPNGRTPTARPDVKAGVVLLENGARCKDDKPGPAAGPEPRHTWRHPKAQPDAALVNIAAHDGCFVAIYKQKDGRIVTFQAVPL